MWAFSFAYFLHNRKTSMGFVLEVTMKLDMSSHYSVKRYCGIAFFIYGFPKVWEPEMALMEDEDGNQNDGETGEGEWVDQDESCGQVIVVMVGDDRKYTVDIDNLAELKEDVYCPECGQIGCHAYV